MTLAKPRLDFERKFNLAVTSSGLRWWWGWCDGGAGFVELSILGRVHSAVSGAGCGCAGEADRVERQRRPEEDWFGGFGRL